MKRSLVLTLLVFAPIVAAADLPAPGHVRVEAANQVLHVSWDAAGSTEVTGYTVRVYSGPDLVQTLDATGTAATFRGVNGRAYAVTVAAHDAAGMEGAPSAPVTATPILERDQTYLALGLIVVWFGIWMYAFLLTRTERDLRNRIERLRSERQRLGERR